jgi:hypothetical protein
MGRNVDTSGIAGHPTKRSRMGAKESSRYASNAAEEYECHIGWISKQKENYENVESTERN